MNINVEITDKDVVEFNKFTIRKLVAGKTNSIICFFQALASGAVFGLVVMTVYKIFKDESHMMWNTAAFIFAGLYFFTILLLKAQQSLYWKKMTPNENGLILGKKSIELMEAGIKESSELGYSFFDWRSVEAVEENEGTVYVFVDKALALIFPKASFESEQNHNHFLNELNRLRRQQ